MQAVKALGLRAPRWIWVCAKPLRAVAPSRRDSDRPRMAPPAQPTARAGAAQSAPPHEVHLAAAEPVQPDGCAGAAAGLDRLRDLRPAPPVLRAVGEAAFPAAAAAAENFVALLGSARTRGPRRGGAGGSGGPAGSGCNGQEPFDGASGRGMTRGRVSAATGGRAEGASRAAGVARTMFASTTTSVGPPIIRRCSTLSRRTRMSRRRASTLA